MVEELTLQPGQTVVVSITKYLSYRITHTGWTLHVSSTQPLLVRPETETSVAIAADNAAAEDEV